MQRNAPNQQPFDDRHTVGRYEDWYSTPYGQLADELEQRLLIDLLGQVPAPASVLEIGCGTGHFGAALARRGYQIQGVDLSGPMLKVARERIPVAVGDAACLPFSDDSVDAAVLVALLDFVDDPVAVLREARRVARRDVIVLALISHSALGLRRRIAGWRGHPIFRAARFYSRRQLLTTARQAVASGGPAVEIETRQILVLPPALAGRTPGLERQLSRCNLPCGGLLGLRIPGDPRS